MTLDVMTKDRAEKLPGFGATLEHELGRFYFWADFSDQDHTFFVRPTAENELGCLADVFGIQDGVTRFMAREMFIREGERLRLLEEA
ncbi:hypothetical protein ABZ402_38840 [Streptomyces mirabilis]|uniref:hypothetical protein n=1 Tax=Streptomyces mirabilis TaxID=68239 RepID=UPI0033E6CFC2